MSETRLPMMVRALWDLCADVIAHAVPIRDLRANADLDDMIRMDNQSREHHIAKFGSEGLNEPLSVRIEKEGRETYLEGRGGVDINRAINLAREFSSATGSCEGHEIAHLVHDDYVLLRKWSGVR